MHRCTPVAEHVWSACFHSPSTTFPLLGVQNDTVESLLPLFLSLLKDDWPDVRLAIIGKLQAVNQVSNNL